MAAAVHSRGVTPRSALVTGAASGIGAATVAALRRRGWRTVGLDLQPCGADVALEADACDEGALRDAVAQADADGALRLLVTAAGHYEATPFEDVEAAALQRMLDVHLGGCASACAAALGALRRTRGAIVTVGSELALSGGVGDAHYVAAKGALVGFTKSLAAELAPDGVRVNMVAPGPTDTPLLATEARAPETVARIPLGRLVRPDEVAQAICHLAEEDSFTVGQVLSPNAGTVI